jgi:hypothetical protein
LQTPKIAQTERKRQSKDKAKTKQRQSRGKAEARKMRALTEKTVTSNVKKSSPKAKEAVRSRNAVYIETGKWRAGGKKGKGTNKQKKKKKKKRKIPQ